MTDYCIFSNDIYMTGGIPEEWKKSNINPVNKKGEKQKVENHTEISLLNACYKLYTKILNEKFKVKTEKFF